MVLLSTNPPRLPLIYSVHVRVLGSLFILFLLMIPIILLLRILYSLIWMMVALWDKCVVLLLFLLNFLSFPAFLWKFIKQSLKEW